MDHAFAHEFKGKKALIVGPDLALAEALMSALSAEGADATHEAGAGDTLSIGKPETIAPFLDRQGPIDFLVVTAAPVKPQPFLDMSAATLNKVLNNELFWVALLMQEAARRMSVAGSGRIIVLCSMSGKAGVHRGAAPYAAAKGGLIALMRVVAAETAGSGVTVNAVATSLFESQVAHLDAERRAEIATGIPVGRFGKPEEAAHAVLYLCSDHAAFVTGETLNLSGGRFMD